MNLKEAFRYQNCLASKIREAGSYLSNQDNLYETTQLHKHHEVKQDLEDKTVIVEVERPYQPDDVVAFIRSLIDEKIVLTGAINAAKESLDVDIDALVEGNKQRQNLITRLQFMTRKIPAKRTNRASGYTFNVEGNQTGYVYEVEETKEPLFKLSTAKAMLKELNELSEQASNTIDVLRIETNVEFEPSMSVTDTFDDAITRFIDAKK